MLNAAHLLSVQVVIAEISRTGAPPAEGGPPLYGCGVRLPIGSGSRRQPDPSWWAIRPAQACGELEAHYPPLAGDIPLAAEEAVPRPLVPHNIPLLSTSDSGPPNPGLFAAPLEGSPQFSSYPREPPSPASESSRIAVASSAGRRGVRHFAIARTQDNACCERIDEAKLHRREPMIARHGQPTTHPLPAPASSTVVPPPLVQRRRRPESGFA